MEQEKTVAGSHLRSIIEAKEETSKEITIEEITRAIVKLLVQQSICIQSGWCRFIKVYQTVIGWIRSQLLGWPWTIEKILTDGVFRRVRS